MDNRNDLSAEERRHQGAECGAKTEGDGISQSDPQISDRKPESKATDTPQGTPDHRMPEGLCRRVMQDTGESGYKDPGDQERSDDPCRESLDDPVNLPGPALDWPKGYEIRGRGQSSDPMIDHANERIRAQTSPLKCEIACKKRAFNGTDNPNASQF